MDNGGTMSNVQRVIQYLNVDINNQLQQCIDKKLSIEDFIKLYSQQKEQYVDLERKAELDSTVQFLINLVCTLLDKVQSKEQASSDSDELIKNLGSKIQQLEQEIESWKNRYELLKKANESNHNDYEWEQFKKWKDNPYWLKSPSDWPFGPTIDSLFDSILNPPHYNQTNKVK